MSQEASIQEIISILEVEMEKKGLTEAEKTARVEMFASLVDAIEKDKVTKATG